MYNKINAIQHMRHNTLPYVYVCLDCNLLPNAVLCCMNFTWRRHWHIGRSQTVTGTVLNVFV